MPLSPDPRPIPEIVRAVLRTAGRFLQRGELTEEGFARQIERLSREELHPRGLEVLIDRGADDCLRFSIKERLDGVVRELVLCADAEEMTETVPDGSEEAQGRGTDLVVPVVPVGSQQTSPPRESVFAGGG